MERGRFFDFLDVLDCVLAIYKHQHCPRISKLDAKAFGAFIELSSFVELLDCRDAQYFLNALDHFKNTNKAF